MSCYHKSLKLRNVSIRLFTGSRRHRRPLNYRNAIAPDHDDEQRRATDRHSADQEVGAALKRPPDWPACTETSAEEHIGNVTLSAERHVIDLTRHEGIDHIFVFRPVAHF